MARKYLPLPPPPRLLPFGIAGWLAWGIARSALRGSRVSAPIRQVPALVLTAALLLAAIAALPALPLQAQTPAAELSGLSLSSGTLRPTFAAATTEYRAAVNYSVNRITVTATAAIGVTVEYLDATDIALDDADINATGFQVDLAVGETAFKAKVTSGTDTETYTVTVERDSAHIFGWTPSRDINALEAAGNASPQGIWSEGTTMWVADDDDDKLYAYTLATDARDATRDISLHSDNGDPQGIWSDETTIWVADDDDDKLYAYALSGGARDASKEFSLHADNGDPAGIWSDGMTIWVAESSGSPRKVFAYTLSGGANDTDKEFVSNWIPVGIWSHGTTMWVVNDVGVNVGLRVEAYTIDLNTDGTAGPNHGHRDTDKLFGLRSTRGTTPMGIWSDGKGAVWITAPDGPKVESYHMLPFSAGSTTLSTLTITDGTSDSALRPAFASTTLSYRTSVTDDVNRVTVSATPSDSTATLAYLDANGEALEDADSNTTGFQVDVGVGTTGIQVLVTTHDGFAFIHRVVVERDSGRPGGWTPTNDLYDLDPIAVNYPAGIWSDGTTMWLTNHSKSTVFAYTLATSLRDTSKEFSLHTDNDDPWGLWSDGTTIWVVDKTDKKVYAYTLDTGARDATQDIDLDSTIDEARGIWSDETTVWIADRFGTQLYAYTLSTGARDTTKEFALAANSEITGIWSDGTILWVADRLADTLYAYQLADGARDLARDIELVLPSPEGVWGRGSTIWVADAGFAFYGLSTALHRVTSYRLPPSSPNDITLSSLSLSPSPLVPSFTANLRPAFSFARVAYRVAVPNRAGRVTVNAAASNSATTVAYQDANGDVLEDADSNASGFQVDVAMGETSISIRLASGGTALTYTVVVERDSAALYGWTPTSDLNDLLQDNPALAGDRIRGVWADETTIYVIGHFEPMVFAYTRADGSRDESKDITTNQGSLAGGLDDGGKAGIWSDGMTMWVLNYVYGEDMNGVDDPNGSGKLFAYTLSDGARDTTKEIPLNLTSYDGARGIWSNGTTIWVSDWIDAKLFAYTLATGARVPASDITLHHLNDSAQGIWSDGTTIWVAQWNSHRVYAYTLATGAYDPDRGFDLAPGNRYPRDMWSDRATLFVPDHFQKVFSYNMPPSSNARLRELELTGIVLDPMFDGGIFSYGTTSVATSQTEVTAVPSDPDATYVVKLNGVEDDDGTVDFEGCGDVVSVEVTAADGMTTQTYTVTIPAHATDVPDLSADAQTLGEVDIGGKACSQIDHTHDVDWFAVDLVAGSTYVIDLEGKATNAGTLFDPILSGVYVTPKGGTEQIIGSPRGIRDDNDGEGNNSRLMFYVVESGRYYIAVRGFSLHTGTYVLSVNQRTLDDLRPIVYPNDPSYDRPNVPAVGEPQDQSGHPLILLRAAPAPDPGPLGSDMPEDTTTTATVIVNGVNNDDPGDDGRYHGQIDHHYDRDWVRVWLRSGRAYVIHMLGAGNAWSEDENSWRLTLEGPQIGGVFLVDRVAGDPYPYGLPGTDGEPTNDEWGAGPQSAAYFTATETGWHYIQAQGQSVVQTGTYAVHVFNLANPWGGPSPAPTSAQSTGETPGRPKGLTGTVAHDAVALTWDDPEDASITGYQILRLDRDVHGVGNFQVHVEDTGSATAAYVDREVEPETRYIYRIKARNAVGLSARSKYFNANTPPAPDAEPNTPATGAPSITGTAVVGGTLTADVSGIEDADGLSGAVYSYQWMISLETASADIPGATGATYSPVASDEGLAISVRVSFTDDAGNAESLTSAETEPVGYAVQAQVANTPATGAPTIGGNPRVGEALRASTSGIADQDGLSNAVYQYQWLADDTEIAGATAAAYTLVDDDAGKAIKVQVSFTDDAGNEESLTSAATVAVEARPNTPATGAPTISGIAQVGETLTANTSGVADADGLSNVQYEYQWLADDSDISGATNATYTLTDSEESKAITVQVSFTDDADNEETLTSAATDAVAGAQPTEPPAKPRNLSATASHDSVTLTWDDPGDDSITGYVILRRNRATTDPGEFTELVADTGSAATTYTDHSVSAETLYTYRIKAINGHGVSELSRWVRADTPAPPVPAPPTGLTATASHHQVVLSWDDPQDDTITGYVILRRNRSTTAPGEFTELVADTGSAANAYTDDSVSADTSYTYKIRAINGHGVSELSRWARADTPAPSPANSPATGAPTIAGTVQVGSTLTADTSGIVDQDGLTNVAYSYQWLADDADIAGATDSSYTPTDGDEGAIIKLRVSFTDDAGNEETLTSVATDTVEVRPNSPATGAPTIAGTAQVGETLTADTSGIVDQDGLTNVAYSYQWLADDADIAGATDSSYTPTDGDEGAIIKLRVSFTDDAGNEETMTSAATEPVGFAVQQQIVNTPATGQPTISGMAQVGETLTADTSGISDVDGLSSASYSYQWLADDAAITGATATTYTLTDSEQGKTVKVRVSFTDDAGNEETLTSVATDTVEARPNSPATGAPTIAGTAQVGETLTADTSGIVDQDGLTNVAYSYQWLADDADIAGATDSSYTPTDGDEGAIIKVRVSFTDDAGNEETLTSVATDTVEARPNSPATGAPTIAGTAQVGETLTADTSGIADGDGLTNAAYSYQWLADDADIAGATDSSYTPTDGDEGAIIKLRVSFTDDAGNEETLTSAATDTVEARPNSPATGQPTIVGTEQVGETLTADTSGIADQDRLSSVSYSYQWLADDAAITGATATTYTLTDSEQGKTVKVRVSFTDDAGNDESLTSAATGTVEARPNSPATGAPVIVGTARVGETLTADTSGIADADGLSSAVYHYQWIVSDGGADLVVPGAKASTYTVLAIDRMLVIKVRVHVTDDRGHVETLTSAPTAVVR